MNFLLQSFQTILLTSLIICIVWLVQFLPVKKAGYGWRKILWLVLAVRLLLPVPIQLNALSEAFEPLEITVDVPEQLMAEAQDKAMANKQSLNLEAENTAAQNQADKAETENLSQTVGNARQNAGQESTDAVLQEGQLMEGNDLAEKSSLPFLNGILILWGAGILFMLGLRGYQYSSMKKKYLTDSCQCEDPAILDHMHRLTEELGIQKELPVKMIKKELCSSPMLFGYIHTVLLLPDHSYSKAELDAILRHELTHYCKKDLWYKLLVVLASDVYWFNPVYRLMKNMAFHDVEYVCDEKATRKMNLNAKKDYSNTVLMTMAAAGNHNFAYTTQFSGTKKNAKERLDNIFSVPDRKIGICVLSALLVLLLTGTACVSLKVEEETVETSAQETKQTQETAEIQEETAEQETESTEAEEKVITIDPYVFTGESDALLAKLQEKYQDCKIEVSDLEVDYWAEEFYENPPTAFSVGNTHTLELAEAGMIADITEALEKKGWLSQMNEPLKAMVSDENGKVYGIPVTPYAYGLMVNVEMFKQAGLVDENGVPLFPQTWEELAKTAVKIKEATGEAGYCQIASDNFAGALYFCNMVWSYGNTELVTVGEDGSYQGHLNSEEAVGAMQFIKDLKWKYDVLTEDPAKEDFMTGFEHLANGTAAMYIAANDAVTFPAMYGMEAANLALGALPAGPGGEQYSDFGSSVIVFSKDAEPEEIDAVLTLLEMQGQSPVANDGAKDRIKGKIQSALDQNGPAISEIPVWKSEELLEYEQSVLAEIGNTDQALYRSYFDKILTPGNLKAVNIPHTTVLYTELSTVLRTVVTDSEADVAALMQKANESWEKSMNFKE